jgi:hypothetical protein
MIWNFFAIGHGKGEVDGCRALLKRELRKEKLNFMGKNYKMQMNVFNL